MYKIVNEELETKKFETIAELKEELAELQFHYGNDVSRRITVFDENDREMGCNQWLALLADLLTKMIRFL